MRGRSATPEGCRACQSTQTQRQRKIIVTCPQQRTPAGVSAGTSNFGEHPFYEVRRTARRAGGGRLPPPSPLPLAPASPRARPPAKVRSSRTPGTGRAWCRPPWPTLQWDPHACMPPGSAALDRLPTRPPRFRSATRIPPAWYRRAEGAGGYGARADGEGRAPVRWVPLAKGRGASAGYYAELAAGASDRGGGPGPGVVSRRRRSRARSRESGAGPASLHPGPTLPGAGPAAHLPDGTSFTSRRAHLRRGAIEGPRRAGSSPPHRS
jgi:hypothetical protein